MCTSWASVGLYLSSLEKRSWAVCLNKGIYVLQMGMQVSSRVAGDNTSSRGPLGIDLKPRAALPNRQRTVPAALKLMFDGLNHHTSFEHAAFGPPLLCQLATGISASKKTFPEHFLVKIGWDIAINCWIRLMLISSKYKLWHCFCLGKLLRSKTFFSM